MTAVRAFCFPSGLEDYLSEDNPVRAIDVFVDELDLAKLGFGGVEPAPGAGVPAQYRVGLADRPPDARLQDDSRLPQGQRQGYVLGAPSSKRPHHQNDDSDHGYRRYLIDNTLELAAPIAIGGEILNARYRLRGISCG